MSKQLRDVYEDAQKRIKRFQRIAGDEDECYVGQVEWVGDTLDELFGLAAGYPQYATWLWQLSRRENVNRRYCKGWDDNEAD